MPIAILGVLAICLALVMLKLVTIPIAIVLVVAGVFGVVAVGERRDQSRQRGFHDPGRHLDGQRGVLAASPDPQPAEFINVQTDVNVATQPFRSDQS